MTIKELSQKYIPRLESVSNKMAYFEFETLLANIISQSREFVITHPEFQINTRQKYQFQKIIKKKLKGYPLAYLLGYQEFYGLKFKVNKNVLIPRPETELIIEEVLKLFNPKLKTTYIDIGTGSGCIIITLAKKILSLQKSKITFLGLDISKKALKIAKNNALYHQIDDKILFLKSNLLNVLTKKTIKIFNKQNIFLIANLPYLSKQEFKNSPTIQKEPKKALTAGKDGLKYYRKLIKQIKKITYEFSEIFLFIEINNNQEKKIIQMIKKELKTKNIKIKKDLHQQTRLVIIKIKN